MLEIEMFVWLTVKEGWLSLLSGNQLTLTEYVFYFLEINLH